MSIASRSPDETARDPQIFLSSRSKRCVNESSKRIVRNHVSSLYKGPRRRSCDKSIRRLIQYNRTIEYIARVASWIALTDEKCCIINS